MGENSRIEGLFIATPRRRRRVMMHVIDAGNGMIKFGCVCGHNTGWIADTQTVAQNKRGMPCPPCNQEPPQ